MDSVRAWQETITIPTYTVGKPDRNPMFLEKRVYQGSSGVVYPYPIIDKVYDNKEDKEYTALFLENRYLKIMILPQLGGRVQMALDKTNNYHFVYYNRVIKPALVGLTGPWISGGIEFNWPQHHRPDTYDPVDFTIEEKEDGSKTIWCSEIEKMFHTKGMAGFTLYPERAYLEVTGKLYNRTPLPQSFLWWANPAVHVDEHYQSVFPPDVTAVYDHGKRDVSTFPIATGTYYKVDYSPGTDISRYKNIPVPTSYMAVDSKFDFVGGYHHRKKAGILHVANHHISPGKKQWTWGCGEFGKAWDRHLTDDDGPYFELMTGVFTDNQPDFSWIMPYEEREFTQYFMPYKGIGYVKNASKEIALNLEISARKAHVGVYVTSFHDNLRIRLQAGEQIYLDEVVELGPETAYLTGIPVSADIPADQFTLIISNGEAQELLSYTPLIVDREAIPKPAQAIPEPEKVDTVEELYLAGLHLEQYRHATFSPVDYYEEGLSRDATDIRCNCALGTWYLRRGQFAKAQSYFKRAIQKQLKHNPNPYNGEAHFLLGLTYKYQRQWEKAYDAFYKATWNAAWQDAAFLELARLTSRRGGDPSPTKSLEQALDLVELSLRRNYFGYQARHLKAALLRKMERWQEALAWVEETIATDPCDFGAKYERFLLIVQAGVEVEARQEEELKQLMRGNPHSYVEIAIDYLQAEMWVEAINLLNSVSGNNEDPMPCYYLAYIYDNLGQVSEARQWAEAGFAIGPERVFPNRLYDLLVLQRITEIAPSDYKAFYYLGNLWYDKRQYQEAIKSWESATRLQAPIPTVHRNLGIAYYNKLHDFETALHHYEKAFTMDSSDARMLLELDHLYRRLNRPPEERFAFLQEKEDLVKQRDDLYIEYITLANLLDHLDQAADLMARRHFHPWEGGEGKVSGQFLYNQVERAKHAIYNESYSEAIDLLLATESYPQNLGEGKIFGARENDICYWLGCAYDGKGDPVTAHSCWNKGSTGISEPTPAYFYNDQAPDQIFYQGLCLKKLSRSADAYECYQKLINYGKVRLKDTVQIDYFAVSLPDLMILDDDLNKRNRILCYYLQGLGYLGTDRKDKASELLKKVLSLDSSHQGAHIHSKMIAQIS
ncbi:MAG: DUF5107 domain-containing protein [Saprospiraceae bacterium]|nr:DUF5107 domain-containing protein [Saprospiraceae bacterium]